MPQRSSAAKRYAEAVANLARGSGGGSWARWREDLAALARAFEDRSLLQAMQSERLTGERRRALLERVLIQSALGDPQPGGGISVGARNLALVLARRRRLELLPDVVAWFDEMADRAQGVRRVTVVTAAPLTPDQRDRLRRRLGSSDPTSSVGALASAGAAAGVGDRGAAREVQLAEEVDPSLLGGLVVRQGDIIQDYSVKARLEALRERLN